MKIRSGFVANSSSSSFLIIDASKGYETINGYELIVDGSKGCTEFGWGPETITDIWSRINFAYLQTQYASFDKQDELLKAALEVTKGHYNSWLLMLEEVIKENSSVTYIEWNLSIDYEDDKYSYIDHQSCSSEGSNVEIFDSKDKLKDFIFGKDSAIELDNDNR